MKMILGLVLIAISIVAIILTEGLLLPIFLPLALYGITLMGVKID